MIDNITPEMQGLARDLSAAFEQGTRPDGTFRRLRDGSPDGETFRRLRDGSPDWMKQVVREAHGDMLPDDYRYAYIEEAADAIADASEDADLDDVSAEFADNVDVYTGDLLAWAASHSQRPGYVNEARGLFGDPAESLEQDLMRGQYMERREVFDTVAQALAELTE